MPDIRLIVTDMDGTFLDENKQMTQENIDAFRQAQARGIKLALCSGRPSNDASQFALEAGLDTYVLGLNGTCCLEHPMGDVWRSYTIPADAMRRLLALTDATGLAYGVFRGRKLIINTPRSVYPDPRPVWGTHVDTPAIIDLTFNNEGLEEAIEAGVNKVMIHDPDFTGSRIPEFFAVLEREMPELELTSSWISNIEVNPKGLNKGFAVRMLAQELGLNMDQVLVLGDNDNDVSMLECTPYSVAMGNSTPAALATASYITCDYTRSGLAKAVRAIALGEDVPCVRRMI